MMASDSRGRVARVRIVPFAGVCVLGWAVESLAASVAWWEFWLSLALALSSGAMAFAVIRTQHQVWLAVVPSALLLLGAVALLRDSGGGLSTGAGALAILPVFQTALYSRSRRDLAVILTGLALFFLIPIWVVGSPEYPDAQYRTVLLAVAADATIGLTVQGLVGRVRAAAGAASAQTQMMERVSRVVHELSDSTDPRGAACRAALDVGQAQAAILFEPGSDPALLTYVTSAGCAGPTSPAPLPQASPAYQALRAKAPLVLTDGRASRVGLPDLSTAGDRASSLLYQPLLHRGQPLGMLVVVWSERIRTAGSRATAIGLLAHEAAAAIARADEMTSLSDAALTDELTGLPNRRAWRKRLSRISNADSELVVGVLDLDHFKAFNDIHGHPAGDLLLKETAAAWRDQLRPDDFLARIGGEEFGLLLAECEPSAALRIVTRLRHAVTSEQTCSAGIAELLPGEPVASAINRADQALYRAKASGRDTICVAGDVPSIPKDAPVA